MARNSFLYRRRPAALSIAGSVFGGISLLRQTALPPSGCKAFHALPGLNLSAARCAGGVFTFEEVTMWVRNCLGLVVLLSAV